MCRFIVLVLLLFTGKSSEHNRSALKPLIANANPIGDEDLVYFAASMLFRWDFGVKDGYLCTGSIIAPKWILTAASCLKKNTVLIEVFEMSCPRDYRGEFYRESMLGRHKWIQHPEFNMISDYDYNVQANLMLVEIGKPYKLNRYPKLYGWPELFKTKSDGPNEFSKHQNGRIVGCGDVTLGSKQDTKKDGSYTGEKMQIGYLRSHYGPKACKPEGVMGDEWQPWLCMTLDKHMACDGDIGGPFFRAEVELIGVFALQYGTNQDTPCGQLALCGCNKTQTAFIFLWYYRDWLRNVTKLHFQDSKKKKHPSRIWKYQKRFKKKHRRVFNSDDSMEIDEADLTETSIPHDENERSPYYTDEEDKQNKQPISFSFDNGGRTSKTWCWFLVPIMFWIRTKQGFI